MVKPPATALAAAPAETSAKESLRLVKTPMMVAVGVRCERDFVRSKRTPSVIQVTRCEAQLLQYLVAVSTS